MFWKRKKAARPNVDYKRIADIIVNEIGKTISSNFSVEIVEHRGLISGKPVYSYSIAMSRKSYLDGNGNSVELHPGQCGTKYLMYSGYPCKKTEDAYKSLVKSFLGNEKNELGVHSETSLMMKLKLIGAL